MVVLITVPPEATVSDAPTVKLVVEETGNPPDETGNPPDETGKPPEETVSNVLVR